MKIGVNLLQYTDVQGIEVFAKNLLASLARQAPDHEFVFFVNQESAKIFNLSTGNIRVIVKNFKKLSKLRLIIYQQFGLIRALRQEKIDWLYCPSLAAPIFYRKKIVTIHDCAALRFKEEAGPIARFYLRAVLWSVKYWSNPIITVSNFAKQEIIGLLKVPALKITVISEGVPLVAAISRDEVDAILRKFSLLNKNFFFFVGNLRPRKNIKRLLEAWTDFFSSHQNFSLVIAGKGSGQIEQKFSGDRQVVFLGVISEAEKAALYQRAVALIFPSLYEGFGLPILEAQSLGIPVLTARGSALPEVAGAGALFIDPYDHLAIASSLAEISAPQFPRGDLIEKGHRNLERFSWDKSAQTLLTVINSLAE